MKKTVIVILSLVWATIAYSQDNQSLDRIIRLAKDSVILAEKVHKSDSIISVMRDSLSSVAKQRDELMKKNKKLSNKSDKLNIWNGAKERFRLKNEVKDLNQRLAIKSDSIKMVVNTCESDKQRRFDEGRASVIDEIKQTYSVDFETLINVTQNSAERDIKIVGGGVKALNDLNAFCQARQVLSMRYNEKDIKNAISIISKIPQSKSVLQLKKLLERYEKLNFELKEIIEMIVKDDKKKIAETEEQMDDKINNVSHLVTRFIYDRDFDFKEYSYMGKIIFELICRKYDNANADVRDLLEKL